MRPRLLRKLLTASFGGQSDTANLTSTELRRVGAKLAEAASDARALVSYASDERRARANAELAINACVKSRRANLARCKSAFATATTALQEASEALQIAQRAEVRGNQALVLLEDQLKELETAEEELYLPLKTGAVVGAEVKKHVTMLAEVAKAFEFDQTILDELPRVLSIEPVVCSSVDKTVMLMFEVQLSIRVAEIDLALAKHAPKREVRALTVRSLSRKHEKERIAHQESAAAVDMALAILNKSSAALSQATRASAAFSSQLRASKAVRDTLKRQATDFQEGPLAVIDAMMSTVPNRADVPSSKRLKFVEVGVEC